MATLDPDDPRPPYVQVAAAVRAEIEAGRIGPGERLDSYLQLAERYGVAIGTVRSAVGVLRTEGLIVSRHGKGTYVRTNADGAATASLDDLEALRRDVLVLTERLDAVERQLPRVATD